MGFLDEFGFEELVKLFVDPSVSLGVEPTAFLNDRLVGQIHVEIVDNDR